LSGDPRKDSKRPEDDEAQSSALAAYFRYSTVGLQFFLSVGLFTGGGIWLDRRLGTVVLFTLAGLALGFSGGLYSLYREFYSRPGPPEKSSNSSGSSPKTRTPKDPS
jgi:hypothetical protein